MAKKRKNANPVSAASNTVIAWAFIVGVIIAVIIGLFGTSSALQPYQAHLVSLLVLAGLIVGMFKISAKETNNYLLAVVAIVIVTALAGNNLNSIAYVGIYLENVFNALMAFLVPAALVVGLKAVYYISKD